MGGESDDFHCHSNLTRAVAPYGLNEFDVHDVINVFQVTKLDEKGRYCMGASPAKKGDYFEFFAEVDPALRLVDLSRRRSLPLGLGWKRRNARNRPAVGRRGLQHDGLEYLGRMEVPRTL
ncbi:meiotic chromosome segregation protein [Coccidioides immitis H538.4]|uniref:Meiotic chromosome segregation protein n=1 Tax=Coccidioides immitis H538.4 TaxID=396776 RepID=A0A0J8UEG8_COCIT|nr:meiotic chromosome segregation protein [Coccidioides immitis H538.4]